MQAQTLVDWGEVEEGYLSVFYAIAEATKGMWPGTATKEVVVRFHYKPAHSEEEAVFTVPADWGEEQISKFLCLVWEMMTIY